VRVSHVRTPSVMQPHLRQNMPGSMIRQESLHCLAASTMILNGLSLTDRSEASRL
jgi:hypothetical protein